MGMGRLMNRMEKKKDEPDESAMMSLIKYCDEGNGQEMVTSIILSPYSLVQLYSFVISMNDHSIISLNSLHGERV